MISLRIFLASFFVFTLVQVGAAASLKRLDTLTKQCRINVDNYHFDLCPLLNEQHNSGQVDLVLRYETPPTITTIVYNISLNGPLPNSGAVPNDEQCVSGTWICMTTHGLPGRDLRNAEPDTQANPIVMEVPQSDPGQGPSVGDREDFGIYAELRESVEDESPSLSIHMRGGHYPRVPQRVQIDFECAESEDDAPKLSKVWNGTHLFTWKTKHACARVYQTYLEDGGEADIPTEDEEPSDPSEHVDDPPGNQDLLSPPISPDRRGPSITTVLVCSGAVVLGLGYLAIRPPALLRKRIHAIRRARFLRGIGETKLLHWAAEDIEMLRDDEFEEDEMVNSRPLPDEEIPLRPSQTRTTFIDYGTAR